MTGRAGSAGYTYFTSIIAPGLARGFSIWSDNVERKILRGALYVIGPLALALWVIAFGNEKPSAEPLWLTFVICLAALAISARAPERPTLEPEQPYRSNPPAY